MIYLASGSPRRKEILRATGIPFKVVSSRYRERPVRDISPRRRRGSPHRAARRLAVEHASGKAKKAVLPKRARYVLGADTIVYAAGQILGKPRNRAEAVWMLKLLSGKMHRVYSGVALWDRLTNRILTGCEVTRVWIKPLTEEEIRDYIERVHALDKAGAYAIQMRPKIVTKIRGSYSNVVGLPKERVKKLIQTLKDNS